MKKLLLTAFILTVFGFYAGAQTKGTNTLGLGVSIISTKYESSSTTTTSKSNSFTLGYGSFIKDNLRLGINASFFHVTQADDAKTNGYGGSVSLQQYYPLLKKFYAFAGGRLLYNYSKTTPSVDNQSGISDLINSKTNIYQAGAYGGATYFVSKRFALEADLLSANISVLHSETLNGNAKGSQTQFDLSTAGAINNLGFRIYFLF